MKVGITIGFNNSTKGKDYNLFVNGLRQHIFFLADTLKNIKEVKDVFIVNVGTNHHSEQSLPKGYKFKEFDEVKNDIAVLIELGMEVSRERVQYLKGRGCKFIGYGAGNSYIIGLEKMIFSDTKGDLAVRKDLFDEFWTNEQHLNTNKYFWEGILDTEVKSFTHVWSPSFIDKAVKFEKFKNETPYISILEPNINVVKSFIYPLLIAEKVHRSNKDLIKHVFLTNTYKLKEKPMFRRIYKSMDLHTDKKLSSEGRFKTVDYLNKYGDIIVGHQWENGLNYLYYELLHLNYPFVHNSPFIKDYGYYYPGFNVEAGAKQLKKSIIKHMDNKKEYDEKCKRLIWSVSPYNPDVIEEYRQGLLNLLKK